MTIEESIQVLCANVMVAVDRAEMSEACSKMVEDALNVAIASLDAWEKVIEELRNETDIEVFKPNKECGIYCRMYDVEMLIRKHLQEVTG